MMKTIHFRCKPFILLVGISISVVLWMLIRQYHPLPMEKRVLRTEGAQFYLGGKPFRILSGSIHYFRVVPEYWKDRLQKLKYMGLNTVETYVPWNLHEEIKGKFNFKGILDIERFIRMAHSLGLYVIIRPGPYICAEWDLGGLPSWLLRDPKMRLRSMYYPFINAVDIFFNKLIPILVPLQFSQGGPIIAFQVENEYGSFGTDDLSSEYMAHLKDLMISAGLSELLFTSDGIKQIQQNHYQLPGVLKTANFQNNETTYLAKLKELQPNKPLMVAEFWPGWFDHWGENHHKMEVKKVVSRVSNILRLGASINFYMFHGGTNFGFMNGGNYAKGSKDMYKPTVTSYDYDAPLSEAGDMTEKFKALKELIKEYNPDAEEKIPSSLSNHHRMAYEVVEIQHFVQLRDLLHFCTSVESDDVMPMEMLPINDDSGQGYGFTLYQAQLEKATEEIKIHTVRDRAQVLLDSKVIHTIDAMKQKGETQYIDETELSTVSIKLEKPKTGLLSILVENLGRVNFLKEIDRQRKGILGDVEVDGKKPTKWKIFALDFKEHFLDKLSESKTGVWKELRDGNIPAGPTLYRAIFAVGGAPSDTFLHMKGWTKGVCFVNGHNLGRYWNVGPQETLYVPAPWLRKGENELLVFELDSCEAPEVSFSTEPVIKGNPVYSW